MMCETVRESVVRFTDRRAVARERAILAEAALSDCRLCPQNCGVDRLAGETGWCRAGAKARVFCTQVEVGEELDLIPTFAIAFSGCDMRCAFCITGQDSWNPQRGEDLDTRLIAGKAAAALEAGAQTVTIRGGESTIHLPEAIRLVAVLPSQARLVWKTNAYMTSQARELLDGLFDVWVADYKFGNDDCAKRLAAVTDYQRPVQETLLWAGARTALIVRHLLMPGHVDCCWEPVARWMARNLPAAKISLRCGFWPAWKARRHPELRGPVGAGDIQRAMEIGRCYGLHLIE